MSALRKSLLGLILATAACAPPADVDGGKSSIEPAGTVASDPTRPIAATVVGSGPPFATWTVHRVDLEVFPEYQDVAADLASDNTAEPITRALVALGYMSIQEPPEDSFDGARTVVFTKKGQETFKTAGEQPQHRREGNSVAIVVRKRELVEVTGIATGEAGIAEVQFRWRWALTPLASELAARCPLFKRLYISTEARDGVAVIRRYDDGWRLEQISTEAGLEGSGGEIIRRMVTAVIRESPKFTAPALKAVPLGSENFYDRRESTDWKELANALVKLGYVSREKERRWGDDYKHVLTEKGASRFRVSRRDVMALSHPIHIHVASREFVGVTGVTEEGTGQRTLKFRWRWSYTDIGREVWEVSRQAAEPEREHWFRSPGDGSARLRLYDDGWRVEGIELD